MGDECRLLGYGCRYVDRKIFVERVFNVFDILYYDVKIYVFIISLLVSFGLMNKVELVEVSFGVSFGWCE